MKSSFHVNISEQFMILKCMKSSFEASVNMNLYEDVDDDDCLMKEFSCSETNLILTPTFLNLQVITF